MLYPGQIASPYGNVIIDERDSPAKWIDHSNNLVIELKRTGKRMFAITKAYTKEGDASRTKTATIVPGSIQVNENNQLISFSYECNGKVSTLDAETADSRCLPDSLSEKNQTPQYLFPGVGLYRSFFIGLFGLPSSGKTSLAQALCSVDCLNELSRLLGVNVDAQSVNARLIEVDSTPMGKLLGLPLRISHKGDTIMVFIIDLSGETFESDSTSDKASDIADFRSWSRSLLDAYIVISDPRDIIARDEINCCDKPKQNASGIREMIHAISRANRHLVSAHVLTHGNLIQKSFCPIYDRGGLPALFSASPVFDPVPSIASGGQLNHHQLRHIRLARQVFQKVIPAARAQENTPCFIVSSGTPTGTGSGMDLRGICNVSLPFAYILREILHL